MKKYIVYVDNGQYCYKIAVPAKNEEDAKNFVRGNGEIIAIKDITSDFPISLEKVTQALANAHFGEIEIDLITRCLSFTKIAE